MLAFRGAALAALLLGTPALADDWPQWMGPNRDDVWRETGLLDKFPEGGPKVLWRAKVHHGYAGPAVAGGLVYLPDFVTDVDLIKRNPFSNNAARGKERVLCLDAKSGQEVWKHEYDCTYAISYPFGPRCTPTVHGGKVYTLGAEGHLYCLDAKKGGVVWSKDFKKDYRATTALWGYASHPLIEGNKLICVVGGKGALAVAFDKDTGKELWKSLDTPTSTTGAAPGYSPPTLIEAGGKRQLLIWSGLNLHGLDPETGKPYWSEPLETRDAMSIMAPRQIGNQLFAGGREDVSRLYKLRSDKPGAQVVWTGNRDKGLGPINMTPFLEDGLILGVNQSGLMHAVDLATGKRLWGTARPVTGTDRPVSSGTTFLTKNGERFVLFSETGHLILARMDRKGYTEIDRAKILEPTTPSMGRLVVWSHPAYADRCCFARNDKEIVCVSLAK